MSLAARRLTDAHRIAQARIGVQIVQQMRAIWPLLDPANLDESFHRWLVTAIPLVQAHRATSAQLAADYLGTFKRMQLGPATQHRPVIQAHADDQQLTTSLMVTGPVSVKRAMLRSVPIERAMQIAEGAAAAAAMRMVLNGGRETITATVKADPQASGWERVASGNACQFCSDLDGTAVSSDDTDFQAHDGCACSAEPVYG